METGVKGKKGEALEAKWESVVKWNCNIIFGSISSNCHQKG